MVVHQTVQINAKPSPSAAWEAYRALAVQMIENPALAGDLAYCTKTARAYNNWQALFLASEAH